MSEPVRVYATGDRVNGELMKARLEAEGIPVLIKGEGEGPYRAGPTYLYVPASEAQHARELIDAVASGAFALKEFEEPDTG